MDGKRVERDGMGEILVDSNRLWGAQTQRSLNYFKIGKEKMPLEVVMALVGIKASAAQVNQRLGLISMEQAESISKACKEILNGEHLEEFPLSVWQTGSGTQTNMNVNEVIATIASGGPEKMPRAVHPNDHVNKSQSSNDVFPTAMHIATVLKIENDLIPAIENLRNAFKALEEENAQVIKIGRTHLQDATPITLGQEISGWEEMLNNSLEMIKASLKGLRSLAIGGTAVGTGINAPVGFGEEMAKELSLCFGSQFISSENKFHSLTSKDDLIFCHGALKALAANLMKIGNDVRFLASGPRCGLGELYIPENEPGSSIMPGKVNPTQCEALTMVCCQVMGNDVTVGISGSQGNFQLNVYMPVIIYNVLQSIELLSDAMNSFRENCAYGIKANRGKIASYLENSLMLVTPISLEIGYEKATDIAKKADKEGLSLRESALALGYLSGEDFDRIVDPSKMV